MSSVSFFQCCFSRDDWHACVELRYCDLLLALLLILILRNSLLVNRMLEVLTINLAASLELILPNKQRNLLRYLLQHALAKIVHQVLVDHVRTGVQASWLPCRLGRGLGTKKKGTQRFTRKVPVHMNVYIHTNIHTHIHTYLYLHTYLYTYIHRHIHTYTRIYLPTYIHTYIHTFIHTYIHTYIHSYIHTYIHIFNIIIIYFQAELLAYTHVCSCFNNVDSCERN